MAAYINQLKFGVFSPLSYGDAGGATRLTVYLPLLAVGGALAVAAWLASYKSIRIGFLRLHRISVWVGVAVSSCLLAIAFAPQLVRLVSGAYVLLVDLQRRFVIESA